MQLSRQPCYDAGARGLRLSKQCVSFNVGGMRKGIDQYEAAGTAKNFKSKILNQ
jgi:hypothetical protein